MQRALFHGPGRMSAALAFARQPGTAAQDIKVIAATIMHLCASRSVPSNLHVLVGLDPSILDPSLVSGHQAASALWPPQFGGQTHDLFVQIAADTEVDRVLALRIVDACTAGKMRQVVDLAGGRLLNGQEHFGFSDGSVPTGADLLGALHSSAASANSSPTVEQAAATLREVGHGTWLFFVHFEQRLTAFFEMNEGTRAEVIGRAPATASSNSIRLDLQARETRGAFPADSHWSLMAAKGKRAFLRRGFPCRSTKDGRPVYGLSFLAACERPDAFAAALTDMTEGRDRLLEFVSVLDRAAYFCPPSAEWLVSNLTVHELPPTTAPLQHLASITVYEVAESFFKYINALYEANAFGGTVGAMKLAPDLQTDLDAMHEKLEKQANLPLNSLRQLQEQAEQDANVINSHVGKYLTVS